MNFLKHGLPFLNSKYACAIIWYFVLTHLFRNLSETFKIFLGNHGEDVKELYYYQDSTPTHSYMKALYKYPQNEYPYSELIDVNSRRGPREPEYELLDSGIFYSVYFSSAHIGKKKRIKTFSREFFTNLFCPLTDVIFVFVVEKAITCFLCPLCILYFHLVWEIFPPVLHSVLVKFFSKEAIACFGLKQTGTNQFFWSPALTWRLPALDLLMGCEL